jgi:excinuclease ABC subunit C
LGDVEDRIYFNGSIKEVEKDLLLFFQKLRDEAHRFAISYHRTKREKYVISSVLDRVEFIGPKRKKALFDRFETIENIKNASIDELTKVKGITPKIARAIKEKLITN